MGFGADLKAARIVAGISQAKLAIAAGMYREALARIESDRGCPRQTTMDRINAALSRLTKE